MPSFTFRFLVLDKAKSKDNATLHWQAIADDENDKYFCPVT